MRIMLYFGAWAILPIVIDAALLWGVLAQHWSVALRTLKARAESVATQ